LQDVLGLGGITRMNRPGVAEGNWMWRVRPGDFKPDTIERVRGVTQLYNRLPPEPKAAGKE
jgi:4-alpha-glucanotransferase